MYMLLVDTLNWICSDAVLICRSILFILLLQQWPHLYFYRSPINQSEWHQKKQSKKDSFPLSNLILQVPLIPYWFVTLFTVQFLMIHKYNVISSVCWKVPQVQIFIEDESPTAADENQFEELNIIFRISSNIIYSVLFSENVPFTYW